MLVVAMVAGNVLLSFFGISLSIVRVGGGMLVIASAWRLVNSPDADTERVAAGRIVHPGNGQGPRLLPADLPHQLRPRLDRRGHHGRRVAARPEPRAEPGPAGRLHPGIIVVSVTLYICLRFAAQMLHRLGDNGTAVFMRLSAFIMLCLGVQIFWEGARELMVGVLQQVMQPIPVPKVWV